MVLFILRMSQANLNFQIVIIIKTFYMSKTGQRLLYTFQKKMLIIFFVV